MLVWNHESQQLLQSYIDIFMAGKGNVPSFYILSWPEHIGKSTFVQELAKKYLGDFAYSDFLYIKDFSPELGKKHSIKIELDKSETSKTLADEYQYTDLGVREISNRLQQSFIGGMKIVFLENIERMTSEAANAFLKSCEEPLAHRLIIGTTSHSSQLLDTIISRALVIHFNELSTDELLHFAKENHFFSDNQELRELACGMAMGKPWTLVQLHTLLSQDEALKQKFTTIIPLLSSGNHMFESFDILKEFKKNWILDSFLDGRIAYCTDHGLPAQSKQRMKVKKMMKSNVNVENLMLYGLLT